MPVPYVQAIAEGERSSLAAVPETSRAPIVGHLQWRRRTLAYVGTVRLTVIGCSGSFPGPDSAASCYLVEAEGYRLLLDLGSGALSGVQRHCRLTEIDAVCVSHLHADHCLDLCGLWVTRRYSPDGRMPPLPVHGPVGLAARMARAYDLDPEPGMTGEFEFGTLRAGTRAIGPFTVTTVAMNHPIETYGFRVEHDGGVLAYSADTGPTDALVELAGGADLLLCEASFPQRPDLPTDLHLTGTQAAEHAARAGVARLVLTHLVPWFDPDRIYAEARPYFSGPLDLATPNTTYHLS